MVVSYGCYKVIFVIVVVFNFQLLDNNIKWIDVEESNYQNYIKKLVALCGSLVFNYYHYSIQVRPCSLLFPFMRSWCFILISFLWDLCESLTWMQCFSFYGFLDKEIIFTIIEYISITHFFLNVNKYETYMKKSYFFKKNMSTFLMRNICTIHYSFR